jgi:hypothetical protein
MFGVVVLFSVFVGVVQADCTVIEGGPYSCEKCLKYGFDDGGTWNCLEKAWETCYYYGGQTCFSKIGGYQVRECHEGEFACNLGCCPVGVNAPETPICKDHCTHSTSLTPPETTCSVGLANQYFETYKNDSGNTVTQ